jgi:hypothetical protein
MIHAFMDQFCNVTPGKVLIAPAEHEHNRLIKSMDTAMPRVRARGNRVVVPAHAIQLTDKLQPCGTPRNSSTASSMSSSLNPAACPMAKAARTFATLWSPRNWIFHAATKARMQIHRAGSTSPSCRYAPFKPSSRSCRLKVNKLPFTLLRKLHAPLSSRPKDGCIFI